MAHIGLLTGSFDPIHIGHQQLAQAARQLAGLDEVWFLVNPDPTHKVTRASFLHRHTMVELALQGQIGLRVAPLGAALLDVPHTLPYFMEVMRQFPEHAFQFLIGSDTLARLPTWNNVESVVKNTSYIVIKRQDSPDLKQIQRLLGERGLQLSAQELAAPEVMPVSSTRIRLELAQAGWSRSLAPVVSAYIAEHQLYRP